MSDISDRTPLDDHKILAEHAYEAIKQAILNLQLRPGTQLVERRLAEQFGISKSPVRDALQRLAGEGLVSQTRFSGMTVQSFDPGTVDELYAVREKLEEMAVVLAVPRMTEADLAEARGYLDQADAAMVAGDPQRVASANRHYHLVYGRCSGNRVLDAIVSSMQDRVRIMALLCWSWEKSVGKEEHEQHLAVLEAAEDGDAHRAGRLMHDHIRWFREGYRRAYR